MVPQCFLLFITFVGLLTAQSLNENATTSTTTTATTTTTTITTTTTTTSSPNVTTTIAPAPTVPVYSVSNGSDICLLMQMNLEFGIDYFDQDGHHQSSSLYINSSTTYTKNISGSCTTDSQSLRIQWWPKMIMLFWGFELEFKRISGDQFSLEYLSLNYTLDRSLFPGTNDTTPHFVALNGSLFKRPIGTFYQCMARQTFMLSKAPFVPITTVQPDVTLMITNLKAEPFRASPSPTFVGSMSECPSDIVPNKIVPILVGVALAIMIVIALLTFIISSRRRQSGYQEI